MVTRQIAAEKIVKDLYGGSLYGQGRGFYVTLELLALAWGSRRANGVALTPPTEEIRFHRRGHDFARRLLYDPSKISPDELSSSNQQDTVGLLADVFRSLVVPVPFKRAVGNWGGFHLYPYVGQLIHYDSVNRKETKTKDGGPHVERYLYRGGGALAYDLLRRDPNEDRRLRIEAALAGLTDDSLSPLGTLADRVARHDAHEPTEPTVDGTLAEVGHSGRETGWCELLRSGVANILDLKEIQATRVEHLMYWVPYCLARHQLELAHLEIGFEVQPIVVDIAGIPALRRESRRSFDRHRRYISDALRRRAQRVTEGALTTVDDLRVGTEDVGVFGDLLSGRQSWNTGVGDFYAATLAVVGGINHNTGLRHYTLKLPLLEAIVAATVRSAEGLPFGEFCHDVLFEQLGLIVDARSGARADIARWVDNGDLRINEAGLASLLDALGLMTALSDATRFVGGMAR